MIFNGTPHWNSLPLQNVMTIIQDTDFVSSCIRFVSTGASLVPPCGAALVGRLVGGVSGGLGCVKVKGSSTDRSLK